MASYLPIVVGHGHDIRSNTLGERNLHFDPASMFGDGIVGFYPYLVTILDIAREDSHPSGVCLAAQVQPARECVMTAIP